ncbi:TPA: hypothetical protein ACX6RM_001293 [Photobacterium damselae]
MTKVVIDIKEVPGVAGTMKKVDLKFSFEAETKNATTLERAAILSLQAFLNDKLPQPEFFSDLVEAFALVLNDPTGENCQCSACKKKA